MTNTQTGGRVEAIHKADTSLMLVLGMAWSNTASDHVRVIDETANVNTTLARIAKEIATFLPRGSTREQADALAWVAQRQEEAAEGLRAIGRSVAGQDDGVVGQRQDLLPQAGQHRVGVPARQVGAPDGPREEHVTREAEG